MASLASLPREIVDMVFSNLTYSDIGSVRLVSRDYDCRFRGIFWYLIFHRFHINLQTSLIQRLIEAGEGCALAVSQIEYLIIHPHGDEELECSVITPLLAKALARMPSLRSVEIAVDYGMGRTEFVSGWENKINGFEYWKPVVDAIVESKITTVESITGPKSGMKMHRLEFSPEEVGGVLGFIAGIGGCIEDLTVRVILHSEGPRTPDAPVGYVPKEFNLPKLRRLTLVGVTVTPTDLKEILKSAGVEKIYIKKCDMGDPKKDWFEVIKNLRHGGLRQIKELRLRMRTRRGENDYDLPKLTFSSDKDWTNRGDTCRVALRSGLQKRYVVTHKNLWNEAGTSSDADQFWDSLTNLKWKSKRATRWKRMQTVCDEHSCDMSGIIATADWSEHDWSEDDQYHPIYETRYQEAREKYVRAMGELHAEVDSDCEGFE
ncbi:hypothetical protein TWF481_001157 [Arthrobotrys musiformis]|uniref:F-box domain-containing protein n=1 Tax=Arthrobotrys musiformis TaxID=47236 RepID=A0AAV9WQU5_9PEZI